MSLGWKVLLPVMLGYIILIAGATLALDFAGIRRGPVYGLILFGMNIVLVAVLVLVLDRGRMLSPAYRRMDARRLAALRQMPTTQEGGD
jgi:hypothetical protein